MTLNKVDTDVKVMGSLMTVSLIGIFGMMLVQQIQQITTPTEPEYYGAFWFGPQGHIMNVAYGPEEEPQYFGEAAPGTPDSYPGWRIYRYEYVVDTATGDYLFGTIRYANGTTLFDKVWDNREDYDYV